MNTANATELDNADEGLNFAEPSMGLSVEALVGALEEVKQRVRQLRAQISGLEHRLANAQEEERILTKLLALRRGEHFGQPTAAHVGDVRTTPLQPIASPAKRSHQSVDAVVAILKEADHPVHISELMRLLREQNVVIPGSGTQANLISHLRRDSRIVRPSRGMYGLGVWGLEGMPGQTRRIRKRRRRRRASHKTT